MSTIAGRGVRTLYGSSPVGTTDWVVLIPSLPLDATSISIFDSSGQTLECGICDASAVANSEVRQFIIPPGGADCQIQIPAGQRLSIRALSATANAGENDTNVFF